MKRKIFSLVFCLIAGSGFAQEWCRPVKEDYKDNGGVMLPCEQGGDSVKVFYGEWFQTKEENCGDIILTDSCTLLICSDNHNKEKNLKEINILDGGSKVKIENVHTRPLVSICRKESDYYIKVSKYDNATEYLIVNQTENKIVRKVKKFDEYEKTSLQNCKYLRISVENHVSLVIATDTIQEVEVDGKEDSEIYYNRQNNDSVDIVPVETNLGMNNSTENNAIWVYVVISLVVFTVAIVVFFFVRKKMTNKKLTQEDSTNEENTQDANVSTISENGQNDVNSEKCQEEDHANKRLEEVGETLATYDFVYWKKVNNPTKKQRTINKPYTRVLTIVEVDAEMAINSKRGKQIYIGYKYCIPTILKKIEGTSDTIAKELESVDTLLSIKSPIPGSIYKVDIAKNTGAESAPIFFKCVNRSEPQKEENADTMAIESETNDVHTQEKIDTVKQEECKENETTEVRQAEENVAETLVKPVDEDEKTNHSESSTESGINAEDGSDSEVRTKIEQELEKKYRKEVDDANQKYDDLKAKFDNKLQVEIEREKKRSNREIEKVQQEVEKANRERKKAEDKTKSIKDELEARFDKVRSSLEDARDKADAKYTEAKTSLDATKRELADTSNALSNAQATIGRLEKAQEKFTTTLAYVPFAKDYSEIVLKFANIAEQVRKEVIALLENKDITDPWHIMKSLARYDRVTAKIDLMQFYTDLRMVTEGQMVLKNTTLANYNQNEKPDKLHNSLRNYFFDTYLKNYVEAITVLTETCIGFDRLIAEVTSENTRKFDELAGQLKQCCEDLEITVETPHLFEKVGQRTDLQATLVDANAGFGTGEILEIENCFVYIKGGKRPEGKIYVKVQS